MKFCLFALVIVTAATHAVGQESEVSADAFTSEAAKEAVRVYQERLEFLQKTLDKHKQLAKEELRKSLREDLRQVAEAGELEEVTRLSQFLQKPIPPIQNEPMPSQDALRLQEVEAEAKQFKKELDEYMMLTKTLPQDQDIVRLIGGKTYIRHEGKSRTSAWTFSRDGSVARNGTLAGRWTLVAARTILLKLGQEDLVDMWRFSSDGQSAEVRYIGNGLRAKWKTTAHLEN